MSKQKKWAIGYLVAFIFMIFVNYLTTTNVGGVANDNESIIQPAGFAFSIWGLIYILLFAWVIKAFFAKTWEGSMAYRLKFWPIVNFLLNAVWIIVFTQQWIFASVIVIIALLYTLAEMYSTMTETGYHWFDRLPFSIYFAWVTVATIVNIFTLAVDNNVESILGLGELAWTNLILIVATLIGVAIALYFRDWLYPLVFTWPYFAIYTKNDGEYASLDIVLLVAAIVLLVTAIIVAFKKMRGESKVPAENR
ncbi:tryptophan-rich sensory protein [Salinicoccus bachuensis]|uniref:Tryptophan-rich sensory protein n=1 Tax=Salinicoccus bachuensis TaxID=3136731 RepID=A0ABZ3CG26_9STAP